MQAEPAGATKEKLDAHQGHQGGRRGREAAHSTPFPSPVSHFEADERRVKTIKHVDKGTLRGPGLGQGLCWRRTKWRNSFFR